MQPSDGGQVEDREAILHYVRHQLIGPVDGEHELLPEPPHRRYLTGILFPTDADADESLQEDIQDDAAGDVPGELGEDQGEDPVPLAGQRLPSAVGISFIIPAWEPIRVELHAARYLPSDSNWRRKPITIDGEDSIILDPPERPGMRKTPILDGTVTLDVNWRAFGHGALVTVSLVNRRTLTSKGTVKADDCLFQVVLKCSPTSQAIPPYPTSLSLQSDPEEEELALLYRNVPTFAIGHGAAAIWGGEAAGHTAWVGNSYLPSHSVPRVDFSLKSASNVLSLQRLSTIDDDVLRHLRPVPVLGRLRIWSDELQATRPRIKPALSNAAGSLLDRISTLDRSHARRHRPAGIRRASGPPASFRPGQSRDADADGTRVERLRGQAQAVDRCSADEPDYTSETLSHSWRPFQLAFLLLTLASAALDDSADRGVVDLIWFPTGGGKTEAYLAPCGVHHFPPATRPAGTLAPEPPSSPATRFASLPPSSSSARRPWSAHARASEGEYRTLPAGRPISIGIWIGGGNSPNGYGKAVALEQIKNKEWTSLSFQVDLCPWCGTEIIPRDDAPDEAYGVHPANDSFRMACPNPRCEFHDHLPVSSVDDDIYDNPPTVLIGTVDKFARFPWEERAGVILGAGRDPGAFAHHPGRTAPHIRSAWNHHGLVRGSIRHRHTYARRPARRLLPLQPRSAGRSSR